MLTEITAAVQSAKMAYEAGKALITIDKQFDRAQLQLKIIDLVDSIRELRDQLDDAKKKLEERESVEYDANTGLFWANSPWF
jgi:chaperonin cofactor prefoldin